MVWYEIIEKSLHGVERFNPITLRMAKTPVLAILSAIRLKLVFNLSKEAKMKIPAMIENKKGELGNEMGKLDRVIVKDILHLLHSVKTFNSLCIFIL